VSRGVGFICGLDDRPGKRDECPDALHDWPLPNGYIEAGEVAGNRLYRKWSNVRCPRCGLYGWRPGQVNDGETPTTASHPPSPATGADNRTTTPPERESAADEGKRS